MIKKLTRKEEELKKQKRNQRILGIVLSIIMLGSVFGVIVGSFNAKENSKEQIKYKNLIFTIDNQYYKLNLGQTDFYFTQNPQEFYELNYSSNLTKTLASLITLPLYIDTTDYQVSLEIAQNLQNYVERIQMACLDESNCSDPTLPLKDCTNNIIITRISENNSIYEIENCIYIEAKQEDLLKLTDITILKLLGVI